MSHIYVYLCSNKSIPFELYLSLIMYTILVAAGYCPIRCLFVIIPVVIHSFIAVYHALVWVSPYKYFKGVDYKLR